MIIGSLSMSSVASFAQTTTVAANPPALQFVAPTTYQWKATGTVSNLPQGTTHVKVEVAISKQLEDQTWENFGGVIQIAASGSGTFNFDSGFQTSTQQFANGSVYHSTLTVSYKMGANAKWQVLNAVTSDPITWDP
jgi:hypothetical protein